MKKKVLVIADGNFLAHTSRSLEVAKLLRQLGIDVVFAAEGQYTKLVREKGFQIFPIITLNPEYGLAVSRRGRVNHYDYDLTKRCVEEELKLFDKVKPDLVLADWRIPTSTSCDLACIPLAVILNAAWTDYYTVRIRAVEHFVITRLLGHRITTWIAPLLKKFVIEFDIRPINKFRREKGLQPCKNLWNVMRGDLNLLPDIPEYAPTKNLPSNFHYVGPIVWEPRITAPVWLERVQPDRPTIYFTMGSTGYARFFEQAIDIFGNSEYQCIVTTGGMADLTDIPENFFVTDYAPGSSIMKKTDVVVCHGGNGTIYQAMSQGVPIIGIPTMHDQEFNMQRIEDMKIGIELSELRFRPSHLVNAVEMILAEKSYRENALQYKRILAEYDGPRTAAQLIESFMN